MQFQTLRFFLALALFHFFQPSWAVKPITQQNILGNRFWKNSRSSLDCDSEGTQEQSCKIFIVALYFFKVQNIEGDRRSKPSFAGLLTKYSKQRNLHQTKTKSTILISHKRGRSPPQVLSFKSCWAGYRYICVWARKIICYKLWFHRWVILVQLF